MWVHHCTVPVTFNVTLQTLQGLAPSDLTYLVTLQAPLGKALKMVKEAVSLFTRDKVHESIAHQGIAGKVKRGVEKVVGTCKALRVEKLQEIIATVVVWEVPHITVVFAVLEI